MSVAAARCQGVRALGVRSSAVVARRSVQKQQQQSQSWIVQSRSSQQHHRRECVSTLQQVRHFSGAAAPFEQKLNDMGGESITEGTMMEWTKKVGDYVAKGDVVAMIETDKVTIEVKAEVAGTIAAHLVEVDGNVELGQAIMKIQAGEGSAGAAAAAAAAAPAAASATPAAAAPAAAVSESHSDLKGLRLTFARLRAQRLGLPLPGEQAATPATTAESAPVPSTASTPSAASTTSGPSFAGARPELRLPVSSMRQLVMQRLKSAQNTAALLTTFQEVDMTAFNELQTKYADLLEKKHKTKVSMLSVFAKASALALMEEPGVNAVIDDATNEIVYRDYADISVPIACPRGIVSCVLRNAESKSILQLEKEITGFAERALKDALTPEDLGEPSFGITSTASTGGMLGTGTINQPMSAQLGLNAVKQRPAVVNGKVLARPVMYLNLTYDHRLVDGREAVVFLCSVRDKMEDPTRMLLHL